MRSSRGCRKHPCMCRTTHLDVKERFRLITGAALTTEELKAMYRIIYGTE